MPKDFIAPTLITTGAIASKITKLWDRVYFFAEHHQHETASLLSVWEGVGLPASRTPLFRSKLNIVSWRHRIRGIGVVGSEPA
jgi:hypothetical protein